MVTKAAIGWILPAIGYRRLDKLTPGDIRAVSKAIRDASLAPSTASRYRGVLSKLLKDARLDGHHVPAVVDDVACPRPGRRLTTVGSSGPPPLGIRFHEIVSQST